MDFANESENLVFRVSQADENVRLDSFLAEKIEGWSRSRLQKLIDEGDVLVGGNGVKPSYKLRANEEIEVELITARTEIFRPENIPLEIVFEDDELAVINKPAGMVVHPGAGIDSGTLANAIAYHFNLQIPESHSNNRIGIVHRLDKNTSGLIVVAKNEIAHENLSEQFRNREVYKSYIALVYGKTKEESGKIEEAIARDRSNRLRMAIVKSGRSALSLWRVRQKFERFTLLDVEIKTGRTHQIRVHLAFINHPIVGDELYNGGRDKTVQDSKIRQAIAKLDRFFLHAEKLRFKHPKSGENLSFVAPLPIELKEFLEIL